MQTADKFTLCPQINQPHSVHSKSALVFANQIDYCAAVLNEPGGIKNSV
jgi:hypothetical protein